MQQEAPGIRHSHASRSTTTLVLGIDDRPPEAYLQAVRFVADEANRRRADVVVVHGCEPLATATALAPTQPLSERERRGQELADAAAEMVRRSLDSQLNIATYVDSGTGVSALLELADAAAMIVLQRRSVSAARRWHTGSTTSRVAGQASCPVVIIRDDQGQSFDRSGIVVGVDDRGHAGFALDVAFAEAALRSTPLTAIHAWQWPDLTFATGYVPLDLDEVDRTRLAAEAQLAETISEHAAAFPEVAVNTRVVDGPVTTLLVKASTAAELLVIGRHGHHRTGSLALGSVARHCIKEAACPVIITPIQRPAG